ncbi:MAG: helix-turn-helix transcriptional regulator [Pelistega sp.]|nr:helix-turn-helix transcriptional regulator [Pelistega sp.]
MKNQSTLNFLDIRAIKLIGERLRSARKRRGETLSDAANKVGCSLSTYRRLELGDGTVQTMTLVRALMLYGFEEQVLELGMPDKDARIAEFDMNYRLNMNPLKDD